MTPHPPDHPDEPRDVLGDDLWDRLGQVDTPDLPEGFDARFRQELRDDTPWLRRHWVPVSAGVGGMAAAAAALIVLLQPPPLVEPSIPPPADDLALVAELELVENLDLLAELDLLMAWDGAAP